MSETYELIAESRSIVGKGASRRLRRLEDKIPAIIYGGDKEAYKLSFDHKRTNHFLENEAVYSSILSINIDGKSENAVLKAIQRHPSKPRIIHIDLLRVTGKEKITMRVPLHFIGAEDAPGVKTGGGIVSHQLTDIEISCLPADLPEFIKVDLSNLELDQTLHLTDLTIPKGVEVLALTQETENNLPVASVHLPRVIEEPEEEVEAAGEEGEAAGEEGKAEGEDEGESKSKD